MSLFGQFEWAQRYTNAPGNIVWALLFLGVDWTVAFNGSFKAIGFLNLAISLATLFIHMVPLYKGITSTSRKIIKIAWVLCLLIMIGCEILCLITYLGNTQKNAFNDFIAKKLAQTFLVINLIDGLFWIWGLLSLQSAGGDTVRDNILNQSGQDDQNYYGNNEQGGIGTIHWIKYMFLIFNHALFLTIYITCSLFSLPCPCSLAVRVASASAKGNTQKV